MFSFRRAATMIQPERALPGSEEPVLRGSVKHVIFDTPIEPPPAGSELAYFGMGCFWGAEKLFWSLDGVTSTAVGYQGGYSPNPTYDEVCSGRTGHTEAVRVAFDPAKVSYADLLKVFFENHDPTQGLRQGNDVGSQYRSAIYTASAEQAETVAKVREEFQQALSAKGYGEISTEISTAGTLYLAEAYHQQYLAKNPGGYCPIHATGVSCN